MSEVKNKAASKDAAGSVTVEELRRWLVDGTELAVVDVREHGQYGEGHLFLCVSVPYSRLESRIAQLVPRLSTRVVVYDDGEKGEEQGLARRAARRLQALGYTGVRVLAGGLSAWRAAGYGVFAGVNVPSKTFGEVVELQRHTPRIEAAELARRLARGDDLVVLDGRPLDEYHKMSIPGAVCCPNGELALRALALAPSPETTIVINCAGRTRSLIGAQTLIDLDVPNPVLALENGTQGWFLADLELEHGATRHYPQAVDKDALPARRTAAARFAQRAGAGTIDAAQLRRWQDDPVRTAYLCDVRTPEEFARLTLTGARHAPGGQLIQATDQTLGTRGARVVVFDDDGVRAPVIAAWLAQMNWDVHVLDHRSAAALMQAAAPAKVAEATAAGPAPLDAAGLAGARAAGAVLLDLRPSMSYRREHIEGARWAIRPRLDRTDLPSGSSLVLIVDQVDVARSAALDLAEHGFRVTGMHVGTPKDWRAAGLTVTSTPADPVDAECIDYLFFVHDRHDGNRAAAQQYLDWETGLLAQLDEQERAVISDRLIR